MILEGGSSCQRGGCREERAVGVEINLSPQMGKGKGIPSHLQNRMHSTEMCLPHLTQTLTIREVREGCLNRHPCHQRPGAVVVGG